MAFQQSHCDRQNLQQIEEIRQQYLSYLVDASFVRVDAVCQKELSRYAHLFILYRRSHRPTSARFTSRQRVRFVSLPPDLNTNAQNNESWAINAALAAGLFPKLLIVEKGKMQTLGNSQPVAFHPSSVNFKKTTGGYRWWRDVLNVFHAHVRAVWFAGC
jgi:ATP-dependent RNA helicase DHX29